VSNSHSADPGTEDDAQRHALWRNRDYVAWWTGNTLSALGTSVSAIAYPLLVLYLTGSVGKAGLIGSANLIGILVTALWGGALADRVSRRGILIVGPLVEALTLGAVAVLVRTGYAGLPVLAAAALVSGLCAGVVLGASTPALRRIVSKEQLAAANGQAMARDMAAQLAGSPLGGFLFAAAHWLPFGADAISYVCAAAGALGIRRPLGPDRVVQRAPITVTRDIADGIKFVKDQPFLRFVVLTASVMNMLEQAFLLLLIATVRHRGGTPAMVGVVISMMVVGGLLGSPFASVVTRRFRARLLLCGAVWSIAAGVAAAALVPQVWEIAAVVALTQVAVVPVNVVLQTYVMQLIPDGFLGRVAAVNRFGAYALEWSGPLLAGLLALLFGVPSGLLALLIFLVPLAVIVSISGALDILDTPIGKVAELSAPGSPAGRR
jgi:MFS family permease